MGITVQGLTVQGLTVQGLTVHGLTVYGDHSPWAQGSRAHSSRVSQFMSSQLTGAVHHGTEGMAGP